MARRKRKKTDREAELTQIKQQYESATRKKNIKTILTYTLVIIIIGTASFLLASGRFLSFIQGMSGDNNLTIITDCSKKKNYNKRVCRGSRRKNSKKQWRNLKNPGAGKESTFSLN